MFNVTIFMSLHGCLRHIQPGCMHSRIACQNLQDLEGCHKRWFKAEIEEVCVVYTIVSWRVITQSKPGIDSIPLTILTLKAM